MSYPRYQNIPTKKSDSGKRVTRSVIYPPIPKTNDDIYVITTPGDRVDILAYKYYGSVSLAWIILEANSLSKDSYVMAPGTQVRIPANVNKILTDYTNLNA